MDVIVMKGPLKTNVLPKQQDVNHRVMLLILKILCFSLTQFLVTIYNYSTTQNVPN